MADPISVQCPHCKVKLKLKAAPPAGKKVGCPKCKKPFPVKAPPKKKESDDDFLDALDDLSEDDYEAPEDEDSQDEEEEQPARSTIRSKSGGSTKKGVKGKKGRSKKSSAGPILAIIGGSVAALALVAGLVYLLMNLPAGAGGIRSASGEFIAFAPPDADMYLSARPADIVASPLLASMMQEPNAKTQLAEFEKIFVFPASEVDHLFTAVKVEPNAANAGQPGAAAPMAGNPMMGLPGGMPGLGGRNRSGIQDGVIILRLKNPHGGKVLDQLQQQYPLKTYKDVSYHVSAVPSGPAFFFGDEKHVLLGEPAQIEKVIDRKDQSENNDLLTYFAKEQHFTIVATPKGNNAQAALPGALGQSPQFQNLQKLAQDISKFRLDVNMPSGVDLKVTVTCKTDSGAQQILAEANKGIDGLKQQAVLLKFMFPDIDSVLNTLKVSGSGTNVEGSVSVSSTVIDNLKKMGSPPGGASPGTTLPPGLSPGAFPPGAVPTGAVPPTTTPVVAPPGTTPQQN